MPRTRTAASSLEEYRTKRDFTKTPEPDGTKAKPARQRSRVRPGRRYFCVQKHLASHLHYDFRLEHNGVLLSWAVPKGPSLNPKDKRLAMRVEDHPVEYGDFEGVIREGYGAGIVMLWDRGTWEPQVEDVDAALDKGELKFILHGVKLKGSWVLVRTRSGPSDADGQSRSWLLIKHRDEWAANVDVTKLEKSVKSFGDFADLLVKDKPDIWNSHRPAEGGEAGTMFRNIIEKALKIKAARRSARRKSKAKSAR